MKRNEFFDLVFRFTEHPIPAIYNRHVYLWIGGIGDLFTNIPGGFIKKLDLHLLCKDLSKTPLGDKAAGRVLIDAIDDWLLQNYPSDQQQRGLVVSGLDLLYRYHLALNSFVRLATENSMIIFILPAMDIFSHTPKSLPNYIQFSPNSIKEYIALEIPLEAIVKEE
jgi:hypothetical protein